MASPTTTYAFSLTTYTNPSPSPFTKPKEIPSDMFSFGPVLSCTANTPMASASVAPSAQPSGYPVDRPKGSKASCVISNAYEAGDHAFWDLYACCGSRNITAIGKPLPCTAICYVDGGKQTWQELGECLSKRVPVVICKPDSSEIGRDLPASSASASGSSRPSGSAQPSAATSAANSSPAASKSAASSSAATAAATSVHAAHATFSKAGVVVFALLAVGSAAGMLL